MSSVRQSFCLFFLLVAVQQALAQDSLPDEPPSQLRGTVVNAVTQAPIPRALVASPDNRFATLSDGEGHFEFTLPKGQIEAAEDPAAMRTRYAHLYSGIGLTARKPGFFEDPAISRATRSSEGDFIIRLIPESLIVGRVHLSGSEGLSDVTVQIFPREVIDGIPHWMPGPITRTNSAGEFRFAELRAGEYKLLAQERRDDDPLTATPGQTFGYPPVYYPGAPDFASAATISLAAGQTVEADLSPVRQRYYNVKIPVTSQDSGINVSVVGQQGPGFSLGYNAAAKRIEGLLPNGTYTIQADTFGPTSSSGRVSLRVDGADVEGPAMTLISNSSVRIDVKEDFHDASWTGSGSWNDGKRTFTLRGPRVYLQPRAVSADDFQPPSGGGSLRPPNGPNDDALFLENLPPGKYWLQINTSRGYVASAGMGSQNLLEQPFTLGPGSGPAIEIEMRDDGAQIEGTVTNSDESAAEGPESLGPEPWVYCIPVPDSPGQFLEGPVSEEGKFIYSTVAPGSYRILAFSRRQPRLAYRDPEAMRAYEARGTVVQVAAGQKLSVQVPLIPDID
jgi:hypothetical protein